MDRDTPAHDIFQPEHVVRAGILDLAAGSCQQAVEISPMADLVRREAMLAFNSLRVAEMSTSGSSIISTDVTVGVDVEAMFAGGEPFQFCLDPDVASAPPATVDRPLREKLDDTPGVVALGRRHVAS